MSDSELWSQVTSEQKKLAYTIYEKWLITAKSTERINYQAATDAINASYLAIISLTEGFNSDLFFDLSYFVIFEIYVAQSTLMLI